MGMILGPLGFLLILGTLSYIFKGFWAIQIMFWIYFLLCIHLSRKYSLKIPRIENIFKKDRLLITVIAAVYISLFLFIASNYQILGDADVWFGIATSFARGNYPVVLPWQPDYLTIYHTGTFIVEGALKSLSGMNILVVHAFFAAFLVSAIFLFVTALARNTTKSLISFIPAVVGLVLVGGPLILVSGYFNFIKTTFGNLSSGFREKVTIISSYPQFSDVKSSYGGGATATMDLLMKSFYTFALGVFIVFIYFLFVNDWKQNYLKKHMISAVLIGLITSLDESFFVFSVILFGISFIADNFRKNRKLVIKQVLLSGTLLLATLVLIQNSVRDSFLTPDIGIPRVKLTLPGQRVSSVYEDYEVFYIPKFQLPKYSKSEGAKLDNREYFYRYISENIVERDNSSYLLSKLSAGNGVIRDYLNTRWSLPNIFIVLLIVFTVALILRSKMAFSLSLAALIAMPLFVSIAPTFAGFTAYRFLDRSYHFLIFAIGFLILDIYSLFKKNKYFRLSGLIVFTFFFGPNLITSHASLLDKSIYGQGMQNFKKREYECHQILSQVSKKVAYNKRILFIDEKYPLVSAAPNCIAQAYMNFGLFTSISPPKPKVLNPDGGGEWYDVALSLSPSSLKKLGVDYLYITNDAPERFSDVRKKQLKDASYFNPIYIDRWGILYQVMRGFKDLPEDTVTLEQIAEMIQDNTFVYFDSFPVHEIRRGLTLSLAKRVKLIGPEHHAAGGDFFMYIEDVLPFYRTCEDERCSKELENIKVDYAIMKTKLDPNLFFLDSFKKIIETPQVSLWKKNI